MHHFLSWEAFNTLAQTQGGRQRTNAAVSVRNSEFQKDSLHHIVAYTRLWQRAEGSLTAPRAQRPDSLLTRGGKRLYHSTQRAQGNPLTIDALTH